mgnify:CR=1 FL=1
MNDVTGPGEIVSGLAAEIVALQIAGVFVVFARIGTAMMFLPAFGERGIPARMRLAAAILTTLALTPAIGLPGMAPDRPALFVALIGIEAAIGAWLGLAARTLLAALQFAGAMAGYAAGLANAFAPSVGPFQGATSVANALMLGAVALIFATNTHHVMLDAMLMSYEVMPIGGIMPGDMAREMALAGARSLYLGAMIAAPFLCVSVVVNLGLGLANRMMPTLPVFFVAGPVLIGVGLLVLARVAPMMLETVRGDLARWLGLLVF